MVVSASIDSSILEVGVMMVLVSIDSNQMWTTRTWSQISGFLQKLSSSFHVTQQLRAKNTLDTGSISSGNQDFQTLYELLSLHIPILTIVRFDELSCTLDGIPEMSQSRTNSVHISRISLSQILNEFTSLNLSFGSFDIQTRSHIRTFSRTCIRWKDIVMTKSESNFAPRLNTYAPSMFQTFH